MKTNKIFILGMAVMLMIAATSCKKYLDVNQNEDLPSVVPPKVLLPSTEASLAYSMGGDASRYISTFMQYVTGASRQFYSYNKYSMNEEDFNNLWNNMFADNLHDMNSIIVFAKDHPGQYTAYDAVAKILSAYSLSQSSDWWGNVPFSEAFKGFDNLKPKFDSQEDIYNSCFKLLNEAIDSIDYEVNTAGDDLELPGDFAEDFIYGGDLDLWTSFAFGIKARLHLHLSLRDNANYQNALDDLAAGGLTGNSDDAQFIFTEAASNPWAQYIENRDDIAYAGFCLDNMAANGDPRSATYIDTANANWWGAGYLTDFFGYYTAAIPYFTFTEQKFIEAECKLMTGDNTGAQTAYTEGIQASMDRMSVDATEAAAYITVHGIGGGTQQDMLAKIIYEKYVGTYLQTESWTDWRRTGYPALTPNPEGVISSIPVRFVYPTNENVYNPNCPQGSTLLSPALWWDM
ncbi:hypothetical protein LBMAG27_08500 [Bacteroidota bacterium]|nr:hypothetical protein LBMAG27_08500 [Bacteroidota bacterium]